MPEASSFLCERLAHHYGVHVEKRYGRSLAGLAIDPALFMLLVAYMFAALRAAISLVGRLFE